MVMVTADRWRWWQCLRGAHSRPYHGILDRDDKANAFKGKDSDTKEQGICAWAHHL